MCLSKFIVANTDVILQAWEASFRPLVSPVWASDGASLRDAIEPVLSALAATIDNPQQSSDGKAALPSDARDRCQAHAAARLLAGHTEKQLVEEYRVLRASVFKLWFASPPALHENTAEEVIRFDAAVDTVLAEAVAHYARLIMQSKNLLLAAVAHDLRNPLGSIIMLAQLLSRVGLDSKHLVAASRIVASGQKMSKLVDDLLDFTRIHLGSGFPISLAPANIALIGQHVVNEIRVAHPDRTVQFDAAGATEGAWDAVRIEQALANLLANALQHGSRTEAVSVRIEGEPDRVIVSVHNQGNPIAPEQIPHIFEPLVRLAHAGANGGRRSANFGLGLYIARQIVTAHGGSIDVHSSAEEGTRFVLRLPRHCHT